MIRLARQRFAKARFTIPTCTKDRFLTNNDDGGGDGGDNDCSDDDDDHHHHVEVCVCMCVLLGAILKLERLHKFSQLQE